MEENTMMLKQPRNDAGKLFVFANGHVEEIAADRERIFGRPSGDWIPDIAVKDSRVSRRHGQFMENYMDYMYTDTGSTNGTYLNGKLLEADKPCLLKSGDILSVSDGGVDVVKILYTKNYIKGASWREIPLNDQIAELSVGRKEVLSMNDMAVSRRHASFFNANKGWAIIDHDSLNGVYVEGRRIRQPAYLKKNDIISIAGYLFWFTGNSLICQVENIDTDGGFGRERQPQGAGPGGWNSPGGAGPGGALRHLHRHDHCAVAHGRNIPGHMNELRGAHDPDHFERIAAERFLKIVITLVLRVDRERLADGDLVGVHVRHFDDTFAVVFRESPLQQLHAAEFIAGNINYFAHRLLPVF